MGGKSYFCDYCQCYMKNDINVRKVHNTGLMHKIAKTTYLRPFTDPKQLLEEESPKVPCSRYHVKGFCKFELFCQFTHYTPKQLDELQKIVYRCERLKQKRDHQMKQTLSTESDWKKLLPWNLGSDKKKRKRRRKLSKNLPDSLKALNFKKLTEESVFTEWG